MSRRGRFTFDCIFAAIFVLLVSGGVYYAAQAYVIDRAERNVQNLILSQRGLHHYIQRVMHPAFFKAIDSGEVSRTYYTPQIFSSTYIVRTMHGFYNEELVKHGRPEITYKLAAENPRNPINKAGPREQKLLSLFNESRDLKSHRAIVKIDGKKYLHYAIPFLENKEPCIKCHGKKEDAPAGLLALYPGDAGFNEKLGRIRAIESIYAPLHKEYETTYVLFAAVFAASLSVAALFWFNRRLRTEVGSKTATLQSELQARKEAENELRVQAVLLEEEIAERQKTEEALHRAKEMAESANKAKSAFLANMSHELRTPLNGVVGMAQLLSMAGVNEEQREYLETLQYSADNLIALISDILDITKIEAEQFQIYQAEFSLQGCIDEALVMQMTKIQEKNLQISKEIPRSIPDKIIGDRLRLLQILSNLISNAIKFTEKGSITVSAEITERHGSTLLLDISVADTGIGISSEQLGYVFNMFTQADESYTRRHGGAGLGLAISRKLAELMGGSIRVESTLGKGSTFHILLPCSVPSQPDGAEDNAGDSEAVATTGTELSVLVAEDNQQNCIYARKLLNRMGHRVVVAWESERFDLILMDIQMPEMNGDEVVRIIRQREAGRRTPIIAVTAHAMIGDNQRLLEAGCDGYVAKPFRIETLSEEIRRVLDYTAALTRHPA